MTVTRRRGEKLGRYYTDHRVASAVVNALPLEAGMRVLEPSAGGGAFLEAIYDRCAKEAKFVYLHACDVDPTAPSMIGDGHLYRRHVGDFLAPLPEGWDDFDMVIGNPPYSVTPDGAKRSVEVATDHVDRALQISKRHVVFVLRLGFLGWTRKRALWWQKHPPRAIMTLAPRPSFTGSGTDSAEYAAFWWDKRWGGSTTHKWIQWRSIPPPKEAVK